MGTYRPNQEEMKKIYVYLGINLIFNPFKAFWATKDLLWAKGHLKLY